MSELDHHCLALAINDLRKLPSVQRQRALRQFCAIDARLGQRLMLELCYLGESKTYPLNPPD
ncbi:MAG: hypothetical protein RLZZ374_1058 [Cyanobacteriota bacterium]|jgi:hypothetical protein